MSKVFMPNEFDFTSNMNPFCERQIYHAMRHGDLFEIIWEIEGNDHLSKDSESVKKMYHHLKHDQYRIVPDVKKAIRDYMVFEEETSLRYPFLCSFDELSETALDAIMARCEGRDDTEILYEAISAVVGIK